MTTKKRSPRSRRSDHEEPEFDAEGWPRELRIPDEDEFSHGEWLRLGDVADAITQPETVEAFALALKHARHHSCNTQCCLVGWTGVAFGGAVNPDGLIYRNGSDPAEVTFGTDDTLGEVALSTAHRTFITTYLDVCGWQIDMAEQVWSTRTEERIEKVDDLDDSFLLQTFSDLFEARDGLDGYKALEPRQARAWWIETGRRCGYDVSEFMTPEVRSLIRNAR